MSEPHTALLLVSMTEAADRVATYIRSGGQADFLEQGVTYDAVCMNLLGFGECTRLLPEELKARLPMTPWPDIINLRHRIAHGCDTLKPELLWQVAARDMRMLAGQLAEIRRRA